MVARHPGASFPVHQPQEAVPKSTNVSLSPSLPWSFPFQDPYKTGVRLVALHFPCVPGLEFKNMQCVLHTLHILLRIHWNC